MSAIAEQTPKAALSILVIQLGDEAEVLRSLMAMKAIKHLYPTSKINLIVRKEVSSSAKRVEWLEAVIETPQFGEDHIGKTAALWIDNVIDQNFDILVNWTFSARYVRLAAIVTSLVPAMIKLGDYVREDFAIASFDAWSMYRQSLVKNKIEQDIHSTDIITTQLLTALQIHAGDPNPESGATAVTSRYFFKNITASIPLSWATRTKNLKWVAIESASFSSYEWVESILRRHPDTGVVFLSDPKIKMSFAKEFSERLVIIDESLSTDETIHIFSQIQWLISGKSHLVDLASLMNLRVLYIPENNWAIDGPYGNGHIVIEAANAEAIYGIWSYYHSEWFHKGTFSLVKHFENLSCTASLNSLTVYRARIRPSQEGGGVSYEKIIPEGLTFESWMIRVRGQMARAWFCGWLPSIDAEVAAMKLSPELIKKIRNIQDSVQVLEKLSKQGKSIAVDLAQSAERLRSVKIMSIEDRHHIEESGKKLLEVEALISRVVQVEPELKCVFSFYQILMHNLTGTTIAQMAKESVQAFELMDEGVEIISVYAQKTLQGAKPKSVQPSVHLQIVPEKN